MKPRLLLYCTKAKPYLTMTTDFVSFKRFDCYDRDLGCLNGKIVAECDFEVEELQIVYGKGWETKTIKGTENIEKLTCLNRDKLYQYCKGNGYAIHIKNLHIFDKPKELENYYHFVKYYINELKQPITKAPQNMMYAYDNEGNKYILISIQSQWMRLILNHIKDVEVRRVILKEML